MKGSNIFSMLMFRYIPYWPLFILLMAASWIIAWNYTRYLTPLYEANATILIKNETSQSSDAKMMEALNLVPNQKNVENEIEVIQSRSFMKAVVDTLGLYISIFEEGNIHSNPAYTSSPIAIKAEYTDQLQEQNNIYFTYKKQNETVIINNISYPLNSWVKTPYGNLMFKKNTKQKINASQPLFFNITLPANAVKGILGNLSVYQTNPKSSLITLKLRDNVRERAEDILNGLCKAYYQSSIISKNEMTSNTLAFVEDRIKYIENDLDSLEKKIQNYKATNDITDLSVQGQLYLNNVGSNDKEIAQINLQLAILDQVEKYVVSKNNKDGIVPSTLGLNDPMLNQLLQKLYESDIRYAQMRKTTGENNPTVLAIKVEGDKMRPNILESIHNLRANLLTSLQNSNSTKTTFSSQLNAIPQKERELLDYTRQQAIKNTVYTFLLQKREETALSQSSTIADNQIIDSAESSMIPNSPNKSVIYLMALSFGLLVGIGLVTMREVLNSKVLFRSEIESFTTIPVVAELTRVKEKKTLVVNNPEYLFIAEQFRQLRTAIGLYGKIKTKRKILITSNIAGEGKSFISTNLALSLAIAGKKVVLVDLDFRKSVTSEIFNLTESKGAIEFLEGTCEPYEIIKQTEYGKLSVVPTGRSTSNLAELLLNDKVGTLFKFLEEAFDIVIVDSSPIDPVSDAYILAEYCDTTLFAVRHAYTPKTMIQLMDENSKLKTVNNLSIIFNGIKPRGFMKKGFGFGYGYGYENIYKNDAYKRKFENI